MGGDEDVLWRGSEVRARWAGPRRIQRRSPFVRRTTGSLHLVHAEAPSGKRGRALPERSVLTSAYSGFATGVRVT